jgi:hypothetical protein
MKINALARTKRQPKMTGAHEPPEGGGVANAGGGVMRENNE